MGGIGKTTLVKEVGHQAKRNQILNEVVFVEVSDKPDTKKIQDELANQLGVKFDTEAERVSKLNARLKNDKKVLVILDNIWKRLDLEALGIPCGDDRGGCKLLLTARDRNVLSSMDSKKDFLMGVLKEEEAWRLFKKMAGDVVGQTDKLKSLQTDVCNECQGLPIVITTIARALRNKQRCSEWRDAKRKLREPSPTEFAGLLENGYSKIELSYNYLKSHELKKTLLICSLMENDTTISDLFKLIMGLDILEGANLSMGQAQDKVASLVGELKDSCLLLDGSTSEWFSMHDVVRSVVLIIAYKDHHVFTERNDLEREWSNKEQLKKCTVISLADCHMISGILPLNCPKLEFFSSRMDGPFEIPENFFVGIKNLKVLSFFDLKVSSLPKSLDFLINVQTLCLDCGKFLDVTIIGKLKKLKILSLQSCHIKQLPREIGNLTQLQFLDLTYCEQLEVIVPNVISSLLRLEELYVRGCSILSKVGILKELKGLSKLTTLEIDISDDQILQEDFFSKKFERYDISIGNGATGFGGSWISGDDMKGMSVESYWVIEPADLRTLKLNLNSFIWHEELQLLSNVEFLCVDKLQSIKNDLSELDKKGFSELKYLYVHNNPNIVCVVDSTKCSSHQVFPLLESLIVFNLINLEKICYGLPSTELFYCLKFMEVKSCDKLENIFSFSNASRSLSQLQLIKVEDCKNLAEIFTVESKNRASKNEVIDKIEFCQLRFLKLRELPRIASFYSKINSEDVDIDTVVPFFDEKVVFRSLEVLELKAINFEKIWYDKLPTTSCCYQNLERLIVDGCQKLKFVFPSSIIENFKQLQHLEISYCKELKEIVAKEETEGTTTFIFPRVVFLKLRKLPELTTFYHDKHNSNWPMLKELEVHDCGKLDIFTSEYKVVVPNLEVLNSVNSEILWDSQLVTISSCYQNLTSIILNGCEKLKYVFLPSMVKSFEQLEHIEICNCSVLKEIISKEMEANKTFIFPRVTFLKLENLPELATFYPGVHTSEWPMLKKLEVCNCDKIKIFTSEYMSFPDNNEGQHDIWAKHSLFLVDKINLNLEKLTLSRVDEMITLLHQFPENFCRCTIEIKQDKSANISVGILQRSVKLEKLILSCCSYEEIFTCGEDEKHTKTLIHVKSLELSCLSDAKYLWGKGSKLDSLLQNLEVLEVKFCYRMINVLPSSASFENLTVLNVVSCGGLMNLLTPAIAKNLLQLREMKIEFCRMMTEIVSNKTEDVAAEDEIVFGNLKSLSLHNLGNLICFYSGNYALKFPALEELTVDGCPMMMTFSVGNLNTPSLQKVQRNMWGENILDRESDLNAIIQRLHEEEIDPNSDKLTLSSVDDMIKWLHQFPENFCRCTIEIEQDKSTNISVGILQRSVKLEKLILSDCSYEEIFTCGEDEKHTKILMHVKSLELHYLSYAKYLWGKGSKLDSLLQNLEVLEVNCCNRMINVLPSSASFENLTVLNVVSCDGLMNLLTPSMAKNLVQLREMKIESCGMMTEIVSNKTEDVAADEIVFGNLNLLSLHNLRNLICFYFGNYALKFPALEELTVDGCPMMMTFSVGNLDAPSLQKVQEDWRDKDKWSWNGNLNATIQQLYEKEINPNSDELTLSSVDDMIKWLHQFPENFCRCTIEIKQDKSANISVGILQRSVKLEKLILSDCSYEEIFTCGEDEKHTKILIQIKSLELRNLSDAKYLWGKGSKLDSLLQNLEVLEVDNCDRMINVLPSSASFENLTVLNVDSCYGLMNLLTPSIAKNLVQLREMKIGSCRMMTEVVSNKTEDVAAEDEIVFGKLKLLSLTKLKSLTCFCSGSYALKFPYLEELTVNGCPGMKTFFAGNLYTPSLQKVQEDWSNEDKWSWNGNLNATIQQLYEKEVNSKSEKLILNGKDVTLIWQEQLSEHQFSKVKILKIIMDESSNIPIGILQRFNNLKKLVLRSSSYKEIFSCEKDEKDVSMLTQIKELKLWGLFNLEYMWKEKSHLDSILQNLEMLDVNFCHNLISILPSSATFENLITLKVWYCDGLINLVSSSTAKSLVRLEELRLSECKMMVEVVSSEGGTKAEEIVFDKLKRLSLDNLKNLTSFCSGNYIFKFLALEELNVYKCHNMKTFSEGVLSVPSLRKVKQGWDDRLACWEGDLNTTIQFLHRKK